MKDKQQINAQLRSLAKNIRNLPDDNRVMVAKICRDTEIKPDMPWDETLQYFGCTMVMLFDMLNTQGMSLEAVDNEKVPQPSDN